MKKIAVMILSLLFLLTLNGCTTKTKDGLTEGTYILKGATDTSFNPRITFDLSDNTFTFIYDGFSSYLNVGTFDITDDIITAITNDKKYTYIFSIIDSDTVAFSQKGSSMIEMTVGETLKTVVDSAEFELLSD